MVHHRHVQQLPHRLHIPLLRGPFLHSRARNQDTEASQALAAPKAAQNIAPRQIYTRLAGGRYLFLDIPIEQTASVNANGQWSANARAFTLEKDGFTTQQNKHRNAN